jgi:hypothetical protein
VGALTLPRHYLGIEPAAKQVAGLQRTAAMLKIVAGPATSVRILRGCAEEKLSEVPSRTAELVFSSPPYHDWERYSNEPTQSYRRYSRYEDWLAGFLAPVISESYRVLARKGHLILNVSRSARRPNAPDVQRLAERSGFRLKRRITMLLARVPYLHPTTGPYKGEYLLVFQRP